MEVTVNIRSISYGGDGVGQVVDGPEDLLGITCFVPFSAIGEKVLVRILENKKRYLKTELIKVIENSEHRVTPDCEYFFSCGGCELQHLEYQEQLRSKKEMLISAMRVGKLSSSAIDAFSEIVSSKPYAYRRKINLHVNQEGKIGFFRPKSRSLVVVNQCSIASEKINSAILKCKDLSLAKKISSIVIEEDSKGVILVFKSHYDLNKNEVDDLCDDIKNHFDNFIILANDKIIKAVGRQVVELNIDPRNKLLVPAGSFSQVNWDVNLELINFVTKEFDLDLGSSVCDLYSGAGNFSIPFASNGYKVNAVESSEKLVQVGRSSSVNLNLNKRIKFIKADVKDYLNQKPSFVDLIIADPPRNGLGSLAKKINFSNKMILISCSLSSFVRDLRNLVEEGWRVKEIKAFDMFPQTSYLEIAVSLTR